VTINTPDELAGLGQVELRHLQAFRAVAELRSFGRAAEALAYTQGAVSQQIGALEKALGVPLFRRPGGPRPVELTEAGRLLLGHADEVFATLRRAAGDLAGLRGGTRGRLGIGAFQSVSVRLLPAVVQQLSAELPDLELDLFEHDDHDVLMQRMHARTLDAVFVIDGVVDHPWPQVELMVDQYVAMIPTGGHPAGEPIAFDHLARQPLVGQPENDFCHARVMEAMHAGGYTPRIVFRSADNSTVQAMVRAGRGIAIQPQLCVDMNDPGIVLATIDPPVPPRRIVLIWRDDPDVPPAVTRFVELAGEVARAVSTQLAGELSGLPA